ncbi:MAG: histidinol-phosphate transaminase [Acidobacteria bacterium]|jgi:histidinol-phosphate aminotransferase|nr:histidinol-phosphate transaminase [Acidobacteriota bacterium]
MSDLRPREAVLRMAAYHPPTDGREGKLRLDFNENTVGCSPAVIAALREYTRTTALPVYPEYGDARRELATHFGVAEDELLLTNGTDEAIQILMNTFVDAGDDVLLLKPSYAMYRFYAELAGAAVREVEYLEPHLDFPAEALTAAIRSDTKALFLANPNNPTGSSTSLDVLRRILDRAPQAAVLIDEAYFEFCGLTALPLIGVYPNLFVCRTFSKAYGLAAMRVGCVFSQAGNIAWLRKAQSPYSVNALAAVAAQAAIRDPDYVSSYVAQVVAARDQIIAGLAGLGLPTYPSQANFVLFRAGDRAVPLRDELRRRGILVRDRGADIDGCVRVTCGTPEHASRFLDEIKELW